MSCSPCHADRELLKLLQEEFEALPPVLTAEVALGAAVAIAGEPAGLSFILTKELGENMDHVCLS